MKKVYTAANPAEAHIVRGILESHNIIAEVRGEALFSVRGELPMVGDTFPTVWILQDSDHQQAINVVTEYDSKMKEEGTIGEYWVCSSCGEQLEQQFTACWQCGTPREDIIENRELK
ncbi:MULTISPECIES: putative signal transducing protein [Desulfosediminicola]|uniref:putative signal transducing protein n=1 Tax=Desulfosediminicola TaxID=2886823 RepID=UPI0010ACBE5D|nr:DUF2007 domain-containing protein [Desulfosediminicola ganghwensis]